MTENRIVLEMNGTQAAVLLEGLDLLSRLGTGQFDAIDRVSFLMMKGENRDIKEKTIEQLQKVYFPDLDIRSSYGIRSEKTEEASKIAYDIIQVLRHTLAWERNPEGGIGVDFREPWQASEQPLCTCEIKKEN